MRSTSASAAVLAAGAALAVGAALAEPVSFRDDLPTAIGGIETGLTHFADCADYIAHYEVA